MLLIDLLCPSHRRPERLKKMYESAKDTATFPNEVMIWTLLEPNDPFLKDYENQHCFDGLIVPSLPVGNAAQAWNRLSQVSQGSIVHMTADDLVFLSKGWDMLLRDAFFGYPWRCIHYRDDYKNEEMALNPFVSRTWVTTLGYIHKDLQHFYSDTWFEDIARRAGVLHYLPEVHIRQEHPKLGTAEWDTTYLKNRVPARRAHDQRVWDETSEERQRLSEIIKHELAKTFPLC